jgi:hypothetical protein
MSKPKLTYVDIAVSILESRRQPLSPTELAREARRRGLLRYEGDKPPPSFESTLSQHVKDHQDARLVRYAVQGPRRAIRGSLQFALREWEKQADRGTHYKPPGS